MKIDNSYLIYKHTNKINGKVYIGQTCMDINKRWGKNGSGYQKCIHFYNAIQKYGWENFEHKVLIHGLTKEQADRWEKKLIKLFKTQNEKYGYNIKEGGSNGKMPENVKQKIRIKLQNRFFSQETRQKISESKIGKSPWNKGKTNIYTVDTKQKISNTLKETYKQNGHPSFKKIMRINDNKIYNSMKECAIDNNVTRETVTNHCQNKVKKQKFIYYNDYI